jgi:hypothetical protein
MTFATGHCVDTPEEKAKLVQRDTWAIEQLAEAFAMNPVPKCKCIRDEMALALPAILWVWESVANTNSLRIRSVSCLLCCSVLFCAVV